MREEVSIVIPNFNGRKYLEGCLKSLDRQKMKQFEVILVDNGSTDGSSQWALAQYPQIKIIQFSENTGFCKAVNEGIKAAETPYVLLCSALVKPHAMFCIQVCSSPAQEGCGAVGVGLEEVMGVHRGLEHLSCKG